MPSTSKAQQSFMGAALARKRAGHPRASDPQMSESQLRDFAATKRSGLPGRAPQHHSRGSFGGGPVSGHT
jgi:hypothetical protein